MLTPHQLSCLAWAVENAAAMRGMLTGGPLEVLEQFDDNIATARAALATLHLIPDPNAQET